MVVVGFDSGEIQTYFGLPGSPRVGSGFRVSPGDPVVFVRALDGGNVGDDDEDDIGEDRARAVS